MSCASDVWDRVIPCDAADGFLVIATGYDGRDRQLNEACAIRLLCEGPRPPRSGLYPKGQGDFSMTFHTPRWVSRSVPAAALGLALVGAVSACGSSSNPSSGNLGATGGGGKESTTQICTELTNQGKALESSIVGSMSGLGSAGTDPSTIESQALTTVKAALTQLVGVLRTDAGKASDSGLAKALNDSADELNTEINKVNSIGDLENLGTDMQGMTALDKYCPDALTE
jgi:hypothetical protein